MDIFKNYDEALKMTRAMFHEMGLDGLVLLDDAAPYVARRMSAIMVFSKKRKVRKGQTVEKRGKKYPKSKRCAGKMRVK